MGKADRAIKAEAENERLSKDGAWLEGRRIALEAENERLRVENDSLMVAIDSKTDSIVRGLEAEVERLRDKIKGPSSWPCGICGTPKVLGCPVCGKARIEAQAHKQPFGLSENVRMVQGKRHRNAEARIEAALACHKEWHDGRCYACERAYPCPTVRALRGE